MVKPKFLYHASSQSNLETVGPRLKTAPRDFSEGPVVFATDSFPFATQFLVPTDDSWANGGAFGDTFFFVIGDKERFLETDKGGCIYMVPSGTFKKYYKREWFSKESVKTVGRIHFSSGFDAMIINGVQVYFVSKDSYKEIQEAEDHGMSILNGVQSENEKRGLKVKKFDLYRGSKKKVSSS